MGRLLYVVGVDWLTVVSEHSKVQNEPYSQYLGCRLRSATARSVMFGGAETSEPVHSTVAFRYRDVFLPSKTGYVPIRNTRLMPFLLCTFHIPVLNLCTCTLWPWHSSILNLKRLSPVFGSEMSKIISGLSLPKQSPGMGMSQIMTADLVSSIMAESYWAVLLQGIILPMS